MTARAFDRPKKAFYQVSEHIYTYGRPGEYAPRVKRVHAKSADGRGRPSYRRIRGGEVPVGLPQLRSIPRGLHERLTEADSKPAEA